MTTVTRTTKCPTCHGHGTCEDGSECLTCGGKGEIAVAKRPRRKPCRA